ncbi:MAG TPA: hypothetical protein VGF12_25430, partial [Roseateles sp.]|uniref:hypothetical protein n=1 Tax=Roseateles sp. TaxID=1971397 RepID=UPI002ED7B6F1
RASAAGTGARGQATGPIAGASVPSPSHIGAEGYGPHIDRALVGNDATAAWEAVRWLRRCASTEARRGSFQQARDVGVSPDLMTQLMVEADAEGRLCQTVTAQHQAQLAELASRALRAGVPEAAAAFAAPAFPGELDIAQRQAVADALRRDAEAGDAMGLIGAARSHPAWGLSDAERLGFLVAHGLLQNPPMPPLPDPSLDSSQRAQNALNLAAPPRPEQWAAARQVAQRIVERAAGARP